MSQSGRFVYPSLDRATAEMLIAERQHLDLDDLRDLGGVGHGAAAPPSVGGRAASANRILRIQQAIRTIAEAAGYPSALGEDAQRFDRPCGTALFRQLDIVAWNAADEGVWSFLTLVVVPEIGPWRFPSRSPERLLGRRRNTLRRLWWRAWSLGPDLDYAPEGCTPLREDEFVQIMERPKLGHHRDLAQAIRDAIWRAEQRGLSMARSELVRGLTLRTGALKAHRALELLPAEELAITLDELVVQVQSDNSRSR